MAHDASFKSAPPGISIGHHKYGALPHEQPPKFTDKHEALEFIWKQLNRKDVLKQVWNILEQGGTPWAIARALLYKAMMEGVILLPLAMIIGPIVASMIATVGHAKKIKFKMAPKFRNPNVDNRIKQHIDQKLGRRTPTPLPTSALKQYLLPKAEDVTKAHEEFIGKKNPKVGMLDQIVKQQKVGE
jgi:hypothetical protein